MSDDDLTPEDAVHEQDAVPEDYALLDAHIARTWPHAAPPPGPPAATEAPETAEDTEDALFDAFVAQHFPHAAPR